MGFSIEDFRIAAREAGKSEVYIDEHVNMARRLLSNGLPVIFDIGHLAHYMNLSKRRLLEISEKKDYYCYLAPKKNGGKRRIIVPNDNLKMVQKWINIHVLQAIEPLECVTGFVKKKSIVDNAKIHENKNYVLNFDIKDFFESITKERIERLFYAIGYKHEIALFLADICTTTVNKEYIQWRFNAYDAMHFEPLFSKKEPFLVQGAPTSPAIANMVCYGMDKKLMKYAKRHGINYSRYADDITFSADNQEDLPKVEYIKRLMAEEHFILNEQKTKLLKEGMRQEVTGLLINDHVRIPRVYKKDIYRHLHFCLKYGGISHFSRIHSHYNMSRDWLLGRIYFVNAVEPEEAKKMLDLFNQVDWLKDDA
jgi:retron-type reverse transcriptase